MSLTAVVLEGCRRAALYAAMLFTLDAAGPSSAQPVETAAGPGAPLTIEGPPAGSGLALAAHHLDVRIAGATAAVRALLLLRNDSAADVAAQYVLPHPARMARGDAWNLLGGGEDPALRDDADLSPAAAEQVEAASTQRMRRHDVVVVAPGAMVTVEIERQVPIATRGAVHRLVLPLPIDRDAPWVPRFSADVRVEAERPIRRLSSPTHDVLIDGLGRHAALLSVPDGFVYRQTGIVVEFEVEAPARVAPLLAQGRN